MALALVIAIIADALQFFAGPFGWVWFDQVVDVVAMLLTSALLGIHFLLLPTFILEFIPIAGMLPTWTGCVAVLIALRKKEQKNLQNQPDRNEPPILNNPGNP